MATGNNICNVYNYNVQCKKVVYMIVVSSGLTKLFNSVSHFGVIGVCEPDRWSAGIRLLCKNKNDIMTRERVGLSGVMKECAFTVMLPMISNCRPVGPTNLHITSSTVAVCIWNRSWSLGNVDSSTLISCFSKFRQAIVGREHRPRRSVGRLETRMPGSFYERLLIDDRRQ